MSLHACAGSLQSHIASFISIRISGHITPATPPLAPLAPSWYPLALSWLNLQPHDVRAVEPNPRFSRLCPSLNSHALSWPDTHRHRETLNTLRTTRGAVPEALTGAGGQLLRAETVAHKRGASSVCLWLLMRRISSFPAFGFDKQINNKTRAAHAPRPFPPPTYLSPGPLNFPAAHNTRNFLL